MKSLKYRFNNLKTIYPRYKDSIDHWSTYTKFAMAIKNQKFDEVIIRRYFNKLVDKDDYSKSDKKSILDFLYELSWSKK